MLETAGRLHTWHALKTHQKIILKLKKEENQRKEQMTTANIAIACESLMMPLGKANRYAHKYTTNVIGNVT